MYCGEAGMVHPQQIACDGSEYTTPENASEHFLWRTGKEICPNATDGYRCIGGIKHAIDACAAGTYLDGETLECARCEVGHFCVDGAKVPCPEGFFTYRTDAAGGDGSEGSRHSLSLCVLRVVGRPITRWSQLQAGPKLLQI